MKSNGNAVNKTRSQPTKTYENIIVGNFLVSFGLLMGYRHRHEELNLTEMCVNLTQQTPFDKAVGDALLEVAGTMRILEFKRAASKSVKEVAKLKMLSRALKSSELRHLEGVSRKIHWYVETEDQQPHESIRTRPYLDLRRKKDTTQDLSSFVQGTVSEACNSSISTDESSLYGQYLQLLWRCQGLEMPGAAGILIVQLIGDGQLRFVADKIQNILLTREQRVDQERRLERIVQRERQAQLEKIQVHNELSKDPTVRERLALARELGHSRGRGL